MSIHVSAVYVNLCNSFSFVFV